MEKPITPFVNFLDGSHSPYHTAALLAKELDSAGYTGLSEGEPWTLAPGGKYYLIRGGSSLIAFRIPEGEPTGFMMSASHLDRPGFKVKENGILTGKYTRLAVEKYGGMLMAPWLDRPLSIAGRAMVDTPDGAAQCLIDIDRDLLLIPNVAIHMNRKVNDGYTWNPAVDTLPLLGGAGAAEKLPALLEEAAGGKILSHDLYLYIRQKASVWGVEEEFICAAGLDDLACVWGCAQGFLAAKTSAAVPVLCVFDNEEVGSGTYQGAGSGLLESVLQRICLCMHWELNRMLAQSFMVSADNAHALHPNHPEYSDQTGAPLVNGGVVVKFHADRRYTTDAYSAALFRKLCANADVPTQTFYNRPDMASGSTLGIASLGQVSVPSVDIGLAQLAMHSCCETAGVKDVLYLKEAMTAYYAAAVRLSGNGGFCLV